ncbi:motility protein A [Desulfovibrionales bacterium]
MDLATIIGILLAFGLVFGAMGSDIVLFWDFPSFLIVFGGTLGGALITYPVYHILGLVDVMKNAFLCKRDAPAQLISQFVDFATRVRREGILSLEPQLKEIKDDFLRKALQLTVDGLEPQSIQEILETEIAYLEERHGHGADMLLTLGGLAPALGMIGTVIGLVMMLKSMNDPSSIGPAMAVALITTFYGAVLANLVFNPMAGKLKTRSKEEVLLRSMVIEGVMCLSRGENPRIIEEKLNSYLPPKSRKPTT